MKQHHEIEHRLVRASRAVDFCDAAAIIRDWLVTHDFAGMSTMDMDAYLNAASFAFMLAHPYMRQHIAFPAERVFTIGNQSLHLMIEPA